MKKQLNLKLVKFYLWVALAYGTLSLVSSLGEFSGTFFQAVGNNIWRLIYLTFFNFIFFEYTIPFVTRKRKYLLYNLLTGLLLLWLHCLVWSYGMYAWRLLGIQLHVYAGLVVYKSMDQALASQMGYSMGSVVLFGIARHVYHYIKLRQSAQQLRIEKQQAELNYLKSQTNPHFLFNTLNNIYSLAKSKSDLAPESILRLSKMLRFMLYETNGRFIAIEQELQIITDYIALEKLRYDEELRINFNYDVEDMKQALPPLLLIPLVENAFKHGVSETRSRPFVDIHLSVNKRQLSFVVKNSVESIAGVQQVKENIGLANLRRQLELLYTDYNLSVHQEETSFTATLKINLASHV